MTNQDLRCEWCGMESTYADAQIADIHRTCDSDKNSGKHNWVEITEE